MARKLRSYTALAVKLRGGAGKHADHRLKRQRTRQASKRKAMADWSSSS